ncbi:unnamed protein product [Schistocephalus solidus]|uniref:Protein of unassigned function n=1 Tax=Schistocephalus solidus TaxID=70667 RepID=A0A183TFY4_SCHSO|nr:unnamed protein product [Schistocephalus solidus]
MAMVGHVGCDRFVAVGGIRELATRSLPRNLVTPVTRESYIREARPTSETRFPHCMRAYACALALAVPLRGVKPTVCLTKRNRRHVQHPSPGEIVAPRSFAPSCVLHRSAGRLELRSEYAPSRYGARARACVRACMQP